MAAATIGRDGQLQLILDAAKPLLNSREFGELKKCTLSIATQDEELAASDCFSNAAKVRLRAGHIDLVELSALLRRSNQALEESIEDAEENSLKTMDAPDRFKALASSRKAVPALIANNYTALAVANMPQAAFVAAHRHSMGKQVALETHAKGVDILQRNNMAMMHLYELVKGTGLAALDGNETPAQRLQTAQEQLSQNGVNCDLAELFGSMDQTIAHPSMTVHSPAAYFVELLEYLRHSHPQSPDRMKETTSAGPANNPYKSALGSLFRRRPDLGNLELTAENTDTVLPYVDIVNEIMESFVVHLDSYAKDQSKPKQATIDTSNVRFEDSDELIAQRCSA